MSRTFFKPKCMATGIGSLPHDIPAKGVDIILDKINEIPFWPQLPATGIREGMAWQYSESLPCLMKDEVKDSIYFDTARDFSTDFEIFYEKFLSNDYNHFSMSREYAAGFYEFKERLKKHMPESVKFLKGQVTGPITYGAFLKDEKGIEIIHNDLFFDVIVKGLTMKACWQIEQFREFGLPIIISVDEPGLVSFGSGYSSLDRTLVIKVWSEMIDTIKNAGGTPSIHCCGNTDWSLLFDCQWDIINFDSYNYMEKFALYKDGLIAFLKKGGVLAWGAVPTSEKIDNEDLHSLLSRLEGNMEILISQGIEKELLLNQSIITPSCGMGTLSVEQAGKVMHLTSSLSKEMRRKNLLG